LTITSRVCRWSLIPCWPNLNDPAAVRVKVGGEDAEVAYAGAQGSLFGLDQVNVRRPRSLAGRGEVSIVPAVDGKTANTVRVSIR